ncbi:glycosyltransferase [Hydrocarboniphaga sp.]|uniref:glycosyltransferase n=1 Tax=Hydrocarboniphaga sp. TaxID=2033016 RepID=UPI002ABC3CDB|nr:glycosyltransferase [Hydrocarboniphaga sp.]MDZ4079373.1 glycosyltransferase [Hydrocarboniphaga sp.]
MHDPHSGQASGGVANKRLAVLLSFSGDGGVERMVTHLCTEFANHVQVDLLAIKAQGHHVSRIPPSVNLIRLESRHSWTSVGEIARYLRQAKPDAMLVAKDRAGRAAIRARARVGAQMPLWIRLGTNLSAALERKSAFNRWLRTAPMRRLYALASGVIAVSEGVRQDTLAITGLAPERVRVIRNPVITPELEALAREPVDHPWLPPREQRGEPVIMGMGRLTRQKDFPTLIRAFAAMQAQRPARLILLGEGRDRDALAALAQELGVADRLHFAGFQKNPYAWLSKADLFVLSSAWEGSPNALTEALALGVPSVSTRCPSGPDELLAEGRYGPLVNVGDHAALAVAVSQVLAEPLAPEMLRQAVDEYRVERSAAAYLRTLGL